ncbi:BREX-5 system adenine-specific DNA-methyltransferase PglX [Halorubrum terrestre]|uniref:site-specific DNA-methyltransferase (adenine-specific) n=1 Tax=Halorubrum distributum TaxID=29283 RepID=A0A6B1IFU2_9EURY|nr:BREX-5 system adenine-specific DNA-methyltransferase PglX [Halorubrum terrestre]MYL17498.1 BREX-5 system adenine-specific DNA-methyltransferase PglX [Halorubrum terrestre]
MDGQSTQPRKAQLDKEEREHLEDVVTEMRDRVEANVRYQLEDEYDLDDRPDEDASLSEEQEDLVEAIELEAVDSNYWEDGYEQYITSVGYTIVNRLAGLRCMEVRDFVDDEVTAFRDDGLTPAADRLVTEEFMPEEEAVLKAYRNACNDLAEEIEILFDRSTAYSLIDPDDDTFEDLCGLLDEVPDEVWRGDDVLGWVYEYYNVGQLDEIRSKAKKEGLSPEDIPAANQFYTPHWVVRMLTDNSLGKLYLENTGELQETIKYQESLTPSERKNRPLSPSKSSNIGEFCTYLDSSGTEEYVSDFDHPEEIKVIDPACGSGHFLLYAFDVLERVWRNETTIDYKDIPRKILKNNIYGVDLDMRACQLSAFNLYLKGRTRAEAEGADGFNMPKIGVVCSDAKAADVDGVAEVFEEVVASSSSVRGVLSEEEVYEALENILDSFEDVHGLGSLLDVKGTLGQMFSDEEGGLQLTIEDDFTADYTLSSFLHTLKSQIEEYRDSDSFLAQDLKSFIRLLDILSQDYDVALMNPPYGAQKRMPDQIKEYIEEHYEYPAEYYINFFEVCDKITKDGGRIGMLVPRSFMFKRSFEQFRSDFIGERGAFDFLAEFGLGILDNATVRTVGTVVRTGESQGATGTFLRLYDVDSSEKEEAYSRECLSSPEAAEVTRVFNISLSEFESIPRSPLNYAVPSDVRELHQSDLKLEYNENNNKAVSEIAQGLSTGDNPRFIRQHWEAPDLEYNYPYAKGGSDAWITPNVDKVVQYRSNGREMRPLPGSVLRNTQHYGREGITWTYIKSTGRRFGYLPEGCIFDHAGSMVFPGEDISPWTLLSVLNTDLYHTLFLSLSPDRHWTPGIVSRIPWFENLNDLNQVERDAKKQYGLKLREKVHDPSSPFYIAPELLPEQAVEGFFYDYHPFTDFVDEEWDFELDHANPEQTLEEVSQKASYEAAVREYELEEIASSIEEAVCDELGISEKTHSALQTEIELRTAEQINNRVTEKPEAPASDGSPEKLSDHVKKLLHHIVLERLSTSDDGIVPVTRDGENSQLLQEVEQGFEEIYGENAEDHLREADDILGTQVADEIPYPNLEDWLENDLFSYHVSIMDNTPLFWKMTSNRTVPDPSGKGFSCLINYQKLKPSTFDRIANGYLEPRKSLLREKRTAAKERQSNESLSTQERADATDQFERCSSGLEQINELEKAIQELAQTEPRDWPVDNQKLAAELKQDVEKFREESQGRLSILDELAEHIDMEEQFSTTFYPTIQEQREEWIEGLKEIEDACESFSKDASEPIEASHYDMLEYFDSLIGSTHFASNGILFMTYYFEDGEEYLEDGEQREGLNQEAELLARLAVDLDEYIDLADDISEKCDTLTEDIPSEWDSRALKHITTDGYQPIEKYGVSLNIKPLYEKDIVPEIVGEKVI